MDSEEDNVVIIITNSFNAVHGYTDLLNGYYINNADLLQ